VGEAWDLISGEPERASATRALPEAEDDQLILGMGRDLHSPDLGPLVAKPGRRRLSPEVLRHESKNGLRVTT
jgi:hypothetical protein